MLLKIFLIESILRGFFVFSVGYISFGRLRTTQICDVAEFKKYSFHKHEWTIGEKYLTAWTQLW